jgi:hypothetical protein
LAGSLALVAGAARAADDGLATPGSSWESVFEANGVQVYARPVAGSKIHEVRGVGLVDKPPEQVLSVLRDVEAYPEIMPPTEVARLLRRTGDAAWYYMVINPPVIARRDYCIRSTVGRSPDGTLRTEWTTATDGCPTGRSNVLRIWDNSGQWVLQPEAGGRATRAIYQAHTDPGGDVPAWIVNRTTARSVPDIFASLRRATALPRYRH